MRRPGTEKRARGEYFAEVSVTALVLGVLGVLATISLILASSLGGSHSETGTPFSDLTPAALAELQNDVCYNIGSHSTLTPTEMRTFLVRLYTINGPDRHLRRDAVQQLITRATTQNCPQLAARVAAS